MHKKEIPIKVNCFKKILQADKDPSNCNPWTNCTKFTENFQKSKNLSFDGISVNHESLETLFPHEYVDDAIIDLFAALLADQNKNSNILYFGVHNVKSLIGDNESLILKWSERAFPIFRVDSSCT